MIDPNLVIKTGDETDKWISELLNKIETLERRLSFAAGYISATPEWSDKHPNDVLKWIEKNME